MISKSAPRTVGGLALFGGPPVFAETLHVGRPHLGDTRRILDRLQRVLDSHWLTNDGPSVRALETRIAERLGVAHCVATCNGSVALQLALRARDLQGEVIVPAFTFVATVHALTWLGLTPVFADIDPRTHQVDPRAVAAQIGARTCAILGVHLWGSACDVAELDALAAAHGLDLLFDAAHAFGSVRDAEAGQHCIGGFGAAEAFSFHATKFFHTVEGGAVTTNDGALAERIRRLRDHGFAGPDTVVGLGTNAKMNELSAAVGLVLLDDIDVLLALNRAHHLQYRRELGDIRGVRLIEHDAGANHQYVVLEIDHAETGIARDTLMRALHAENVRVRRYFHPGAHRMEPYASNPRYANRALPHTEAACARVLCLPTGAPVTADDVARVCELIRFIVAHGAEITQRVP